MWIGYSGAVNLDLWFHGFDSPDEWGSRLFASFQGIWVDGTLNPNVSFFEHFHPSSLIAVQIFALYMARGVPFVGPETSVESVSYGRKKTGDRYHCPRGISAVR
jgi:hypothetical protein